jgi:hypothetical protein
LKALLQTDPDNLTPLPQQKIADWRQDNARSLALEPLKPQARASRAPEQPLPPPATAAAAAASGEGSVQHLAELPGRRRSLLVGINYFGTSSELSGCVNDVRRVQPVIKAKWGFQDDADSQRVLLDEPGWPPHLRPTLANLCDAIRWLVEGARTGDALYLHYSGHGGREAKTNGEGYHETLVPLDYETAGMLLDTEMFEALVKPLPSGCRLTCVLDCCHSQGALDLPYVFLGSKENLDKALAGEAMEMAVSKNWGMDLAMWHEGNSAGLLADLGSMGLGLWDLYRKRQEAKGAGASGFGMSEAAENRGLAVGEVIAFTGCRSDQTSADVGNVDEQFTVGTAGTQRVQGHAGGALTAVFLESIEEESSSGATQLTYLQLLDRMRQRLQSEGFEQVPQLASSLVVELKQRFSLTTAFLPPDPAQRGVGGGSRGLDAVDGGIAAGGAACAAGFLAALASAPHGSSMLQEAPGAWLPAASPRFDAYYAPPGEPESSAGWQWPSLLGFGGGGAPGCSFQDALAGGGEDDDEYDEDDGYGDGDDDDEDY